MKYNQESLRLGKRIPRGFEPWLGYETPRLYHRKKLNFPKFLVKSLS